MFTPEPNDEKGSETILIMDLPVELLEKIFQYLPYEAIGKIRLVSKTFNDVCSSLLNSAFQRLQNLMLQRFQKIKSQMPRRESARRKHPLARESDIIETLHMRLTLLQMSFGKHIERKHCCFFAGEILDEVYRILRYVKTTPNLARAYKVTDELFDLSTMAMEYFKEHIEPTLPEITYFGSGSKSCSWKMLDSPGTTSSPTSISNQGGSGDDTGEGSSSGTTLRKKLNHFRQAMKRYDKKQTNMLQDMKRCKNKLGNHERQMEELNNRLEDCNKKAEESSRKFNSVLQELNKCKTELQYWRSKSPANQLCCVCSKMLVSGEEVSATHSNSMEKVALVAKEMPSSTSHSETDFIPIGKPTVDINAENIELLCGPETSSYLPNEDSDNSSPQPSCSKTIDVSPLSQPGLKRTWTSTEKCTEEQPQSKKHCCDKKLVSQIDNVQPPLSQTTKNLIQMNST